MSWFNKDLEFIEKELNSNFQKGLNSNVVNEKLQKFGPNELKEEVKKTFLSKIKDQLSDFMVIILIIAAIISFVIGEKTDSIVIIIIVILNAFLGIFQEGKAEKSLEALKQMSSPTAKVVRDGSLQNINANELVPGDIVSLDAGDIVPADLRLFNSSSLKIEEASLTGESLPVEKNNHTIKDTSTPLGDRYNMAYMSTIVNYGSGLGIVVETGHNTEIGSIATKIQSFEVETTPLQNRLNKLGKSIGITTIIICALVFGVGILQGKEALNMFMVAISLAVAAVPEGLPAIVTIVLALGMNKMVEKHVIVKKLLAVETLGSTTVICSDKTGTLTQNEMTVVNMYVNNKEISVSGVGYEPKGVFKDSNNENVNINSSKELELLLTNSVLANEAELLNNNGSYSIIGDPTEGALLTLAGKSNISKNEYINKYPRVDSIPFDSERKMMTTLHDNYEKGKFISFTKGAPDVIIDRCTHISINGEVKELDSKLKSTILKQNSKFARSALRVLAFAYQEYNEKPNNINSQNIEKNMIFIGLVGIIDPPREEVKEAIERCKNAGITTVMITGDYKETAFAIAKDLGIADRKEQAIMGNEIDSLSDEELKKLVKDVRVYARVSPEHKVRIISAIKSNGDIAAMTGDGVNDAMALKKADIGIAMGITGTDVAKNTADLILTDDNFTSIVSAVEEGRIIYDNIVKFVMFLLSCNIGEVLIVFISIMLGLEVPFIPIQLLWLNLVTDSFPALALGVEKGDPDIMDRKPRNPNSPLLDKENIIAIIVQSITIAASSLFVYIYALNKYVLSPEDIIIARTMVFTTLIMAELLRAYSSRSQNYTIFEIGIFSNTSLILGTGFSFILMLLVIYVPFLQNVFHTIPLNFKQWTIILPLSFAPFIISEIYKYIKNNK